MFTFQYLGKADFDRYAPTLFGILHGNMSEIAPSGCSFEEDYCSWTEAFGGAFKGRAARKLVLILSPENSVVGFFGFCVSEDTFAMEEIQLAAQYQGRYGIFRSLYEFVTEQLPCSLKYVEAYANKSNSKSLGILGRLGLEVIGENKTGSCWHLRGDYSSFLSWLGK